MRNDWKDVMQIIIMLPMGAVFFTFVMLYGMAKLFVKKEGIN